jgi:glucose/arabinose dehydrogenase
VLWFPWEAQQQTLGNQVDLVTGFQEPDGTRWGRPVDAVPGPDGDLYVTDDTAGAVYRIGPATT